MIEKVISNNLKHIRCICKSEKLKSQEAQPVIDDYFEMILNYFKQINEIDHINFDKLSEYPVPMNFDERYHYMVSRKYHFMGYRQMKTLKSELIKMNASYQIRKKRQNNK